MACGLGMPGPREHDWLRNTLRNRDVPGSEGDRFPSPQKGDQYIILVLP